MSATVRAAWLLLQTSRLGVTPTSTRGTKSRSTTYLSLGCRLGASAWLLMCAINKVLPSLGWVATYSAASTPATPGLFSTRTC